VEADALAPLDRLEERAVERVGRVGVGATRRQLLRQRPRLARAAAAAAPPAPSRPTLRRAPIAALVEEPRGAGGERGEDRGERSQRGPVERGRAAPAEVQRVPEAREPGDEAVPERRADGPVVRALPEDGGDRVADRRRRERRGRLL